MHAALPKSKYRRGRTILYRFFCLGWRQWAGGRSRRFRCHWAAGAAGAGTAGSFIGIGTSEKVSKSRLIKD